MGHRWLAEPSGKKYLDCAQSCYILSQKRALFRDKVIIKQGVEEGIPVHTQSMLTIKGPADELYKPSGGKQSTMVHQMLALLKDASGQVQVSNSLQSISQDPPSQLMQTKLLHSETRK
jgi:hypothetical protein